ncbi:MAG: hypothetical protein KKA54_11920 [Proteobacteria bacterium]|nr:hypothetical protein [Pseudomonadota bacterium]MBU0967073.1 hypothetical protein [Pseudomonadota bacterium]
MKTSKKMLINLVAISLTTFFAGSAMAAGNIHFFSEYLGGVTTSQEEAAVIAADREIQRAPVVISSTAGNELTYSSEYMGGFTTLGLEARTAEKDREVMAKPAMVSHRY